MTMMINPIRASLPQTPASNKPRFGFMPAPLLLKSMDFASLGVSTVGQNMGIYGAVIGSRLWQSRSPNERWENARRDVLGWYNWFMGSPIVQIGIVGMLMPQASRRLILNSQAQNGSILKAIVKNPLTFLISPNKLFQIASDAQLHQRKDQILRAMGKAASPEAISKVVTLFEKTRNYRGLTSLFGLAYAFFALGVGINLLNIALTKASLRRAEEPRGQHIPLNLSGNSNSSYPKGLNPAILQQLLAAQQQR